MKKFFKDIVNSIVSFFRWVRGNDKQSVTREQFRFVAPRRQAVAKSFATPDPATSNVIALIIGSQVVRGQRVGGNHRLIVRTQQGPTAFKILGQLRNGSARVRPFGRSSAPILHCQLQLN